ncbi:MAG TPA: anti-sigma factor antagonist [Terriglobales bacterium]|nr:anti-sigma factor antagonist [Terriglobales bacterium]
MPLSMDTRTVGKVAVIRCNGRITAGAEAESLRVHVNSMFARHKDFLLHLGEVGFIDSSGLGTVVRLLSATRRLHGDLKLCNIPPNIEKVLKITNLSALFDAHGSEENAISAFYRRPKAVEAAASVGHSVVCVDKNSDVLAYLRELLCRGGYEVHTTNSLADAAILIRVTRPLVLLVGPSTMGSASAEQAFANASKTVPVMHLENDFATLDAGEAASRLLQGIQALLPHSRNSQAGNS